MSLIKKTARVLLAAVLMLLGALAAPVYAHETVVSSDPAEGASVSAVPPVITITFDGPPQGPTAAVGILVGDAAPITTEGSIQGNALLIDTTGPQVAPLMADPSGPWVVSFQIISSDGDPVSDSVSFSVTAPPASPAAPSMSIQAPTESPATSSAPGSPAEVVSDQGMPWWVFVLIGVGALAAAGAVALRLTRRPPSDS